jgi:hypothetical protein
VTPQLHAGQADDARELAIIRAGQAIERHMGAYQALEQVYA